MARTVADTALMLSVVAGPDDRAPLSYDVDTRAFLRAVKSPSVKGWRVAWTPDLNGLIPVDAEVAAVAEGATRVFRSLGARVEAACPDFSEVQRDRARHARRLDGGQLRRQHLPQLEGRRCRRGSCGTSSRASPSTPAEIGARRDAPHRALAAGARVHGDARPPDPADACGAAVPRRAALPDRDQRQAARQLHPVVLPHLRHHAHRASRHLGALRLHAERRCRWGFRSWAAGARKPSVLRAAAAFEAAAPWADKIPPPCPPPPGSLHASRSARSGSE